MGYRDVSMLTTDKGKIATPYMDQLVTDGITFTDAHTY